MAPRPLGFRLIPDQRADGGQKHATLRRLEGTAMIRGEEDAREKLALCARALGRIGGLGLGGHVTLRIPDSELLVITPGGGLDKEKLTAADMVTVDANGKYVSGPYGPPIEWPIHTAVHRARPEL